MTCNKILYLITITLAFAGVSLSQDVSREPTAPETQYPRYTTKVDEFRHLGDCDAGARIDAFFVALNNDPETKGYVITYLGLDLLPSQLEVPPSLAQIRRAIAFRKYDGSRLVFIDGGYRESYQTEFYLVPPGGAPPEPTETIPRPKAPNGTFIWRHSWLSTDDEYFSLDEFVLPEIKAKEEEDARLADLESAAAGDVESETPPAEVVPPPADPDEEEPKLSPEETRELRFAWADEKFAAEIGKRDGAQGVIIFYADDQYYDIVKLSGFVREGRDVIAARAKLRANRIKVVFGGYRNSTETEYFIVPKGGKPPKPTPEERPVEEDSSAN